MATTVAGPVFEGHSDSDRHLAEIHKRLEGIGMAPAARDWLLKALHPAATHECPGIPDPYEGQIITPDYRDSTVIGPPAGVVGNWDLLVVQLPGDVCGFGYAAGPAGVSFTATTQPANTTANCTVNQPVVPYALNPFSIVRANGTPTVSLQTTRVGQVAAGAWEWRRRYAGMTAYMTASALNDQGTVYASTFATQYVRGGPVDGPTVGSQASTCVSHAYNVPLDETSLQQVSPKPYVAPARHGVYLPSRFLDFDMRLVEMIRTSDAMMCQGIDSATTQVSFLNSETAGAISTVGIPCLSRPLLMEGNFLSAWPSYAWVNPANQTAGTQPLDSGHSGMTPGVMIFRGLSNAASITVRSYYGLELVPTIYSSFRQFCKPAPAYSEIALRTYAAVSHELQYAYPASYNSFGDLLGVIHKVASVLYPPLRSLVSSIPVVGKIATGVGDALLGAPAMPHLSEVQRVSTSDPRPAPKPPMTARVGSVARIRAPCPQCRAGVPHKHKSRRSSSVGSRLSRSSRLSRRSNRR